MGKKSLIVVCGPTGSGKTDLSLALAAKFYAPILSTDSRQIFRGMAIGTAQPDALQLAAASHYMIANHDVDEHYTSGHYEREALEILDKIYSENDVVIAVGGSGLYINALCNGLDELPEADPELRSALEAQWKAEGNENLLEQLQSLDPDYYKIVDKSNPKRVIRALEVCLKSGAPYSTLRRGTSCERGFHILKIGVTLPREELYERINLRVDRMIEAGLEAEARSFYPKRELNALQTVGYREFFDYFDEKATREEAIEAIKRNSRRYAKRQMTWFTKDKTINWFSPKQTEEIAALVEKFLSE